MANCSQFKQKKGERGKELPLRAIIAFGKHRKIPRMKNNENGDFLGRIQCLQLGALQCIDNNAAYFCKCHLQ